MSSNKTTAPYVVLGRIALITAAVAIALSMFRSTREFTYQREISAPCASVLAILQDPYRLANHSPVFESIVPEDDAATQESTAGSARTSHLPRRLSQSQWYRITDRVPVVGSLQTTITVRVKIVPEKDGVEAEVQAGFGTTLKTKYTVKGKANDGKGRSCTLTEVAVVDVRYPLFHLACV